MKLYTRSGDKGKTSVIGGKRDKDDIRIEAYGTCDELNAFVGRAAALLDYERFPDIKMELAQIQHELFDCGSDLSSIKKDTTFKVDESMITFLEERMDDYTEEAPSLQRFILPGGTSAAAELHVCRTVTRRAERLTAKLMREEEMNEDVFKYLNRLSDYFFAAARVVNYRLEIADVEYERSAIVFHTSNKEK
ncbi:cob(I)alamin adenosyltransferase [Salibacterium salarium]|uniref:cob(I)yrinic acid a,c-diamide adenosyltransferase n=1 Tax=Salibacterium salarium TaxID=284579 RepID=UPI0027885777|nr:cob(I)yrinic acid a,c-diamide adenosyltransferase [Salibacterium salarium]MDQ0299483.1 cob(I)alamin adenosyltransferase [Salibacterium salarium]